jgi:hypothetical protein
MPIICIFPILLFLSCYISLFAFWFAVFIFHAIFNRILIQYFSFSRSLVFASYFLLRTFLSFFYLSKMVVIFVLFYCYPFSFIFSLSFFLFLIFRLCFFVSPFIFCFLTFILSCLTFSFVFLSLSLSHLISSSSFCYFDLYLRGVE